MGNAVAAVVAGAVRVLWWIIAWRMEALRERERRRAVVALLGRPGLAPWCPIGGVMAVC